MCLLLTFPFSLATIMTVLGAGTWPQSLYDRWILALFLSLVPAVVWALFGIIGFKIGRRSVR